ncbi:hypothetical protein PAXRUDRAFT_176885, partial [Paxillus rubicundulus Ve08.2h10]
VFSSVISTLIMSRPFTCSHLVIHLSPPSDDGFRTADPSVDFGALVVPSFCNSSSPSHLGDVDSGSRSPSADCVPIEEAAALAENIPGVTLQPPLGDDASVHVLLTPQAPRWVHPHSGDSSAGQTDLPKRKRGKKKADDKSVPSPDVCPLTPAPKVLLWLPSLQAAALSHPPLASVLECLAARGPGPADDVPPPSSHDLYCHSIFAVASEGQDLSIPYVFNAVWKVLAEAVPDIDFLDLLASAPKNLPDPNAHMLLPSFQLATSSVVHSVPSQPELLDGHTLALPSQVINVMKANWTIHIPLAALSTCSLTSLSQSS